MGVVLRVRTYVRPYPVPRTLILTLTQIDNGNLKSRIRDRLAESTLEGSDRLVAFTCEMTCLKW